MLRLGNSLTGVVTIALIAAFLLPVSHARVNADTPDGVTREQLRKHRRIVGRDPNKDYMKIVPPGRGVGIGGVIKKDPTRKWELVCTEKGLCVYVVTTPAQVETTGGMGCHKVKRVVYTIRQIAAQIQEAYGAEDPLIPVLLKMVDRADDVGSMMNKLEDCAIQEFCNLPLNFQNFRRGAYRKFEEAEQEYRRLMDADPDRLSGLPGAKAIIDYQLQQVHEIAGAVDVVYNDKAGEHRLVNQADLTPQSGEEICRIVKDETECRIVH